MRALGALFFILVLALPGAAADIDIRADRVAMARLAFQAKVRLAALLARQGKKDEALRVARDAVQMFRAELDAIGGKEGNRTAVSISVGGGVGLAFRGRPGMRRNLRAGGGSGRTENAVELGLKWLADHQDDDGRWDSDQFMKHDPDGDKSDGPGHAQHDVGVTALATLAFLGAGYTDRGAKAQNRYAKNVRMALRFLMTRQDEQGCFGTRATQQYMYNHTAATLAMCEAYWITRNPRYKRPAEQGLAFLAKARNPRGGWRYGVRPGESDTSVTTWAVLALKSGKFAGLEVDPDAFAGARAWLDRMTDKKTGAVSYNRKGGGVARLDRHAKAFPREKSEAMTAAGVLMRIFLGEDPRSSKIIRMGAALCVEKPPKWQKDGSIDMVYWYFGTLAMFQVGGKHWREWNNAMKEAVLKHQHGKRTGSRLGSWDPEGPWGEVGGRVYATAMMTMSLEVYYRYARVFGVK